MNDSMTTRCPPGQVRVETGETVNVALVRPLRTGNVPVESTVMVSCLLAAWGLLPLLV